MKNTPILFNADMVRAIFNASKTQTRRVIQSPARNMQANGNEVVKRNPDNDKWYKDHIWSMRTKTGTWGDYTHERFLEFCPFGKVGDQLWVRETFAPRADCEISWQRSVIDNHNRMLPSEICYRADNNPKDWVSNWKPSIHMPRWASRINLEVTNIHVECLQEITQADAMAEGWNPKADDGKNPNSLDPKSWYRNLYISIYGAESWDANPWVWVVEFKKGASNA